MDLLINGERLRVESDPETPLLYVLRDELDLTGTKYGCGEGQCGACTVLMDGVPVRSCLIPLREAKAKRIVTIEGLGARGSLHHVQEAFLHAEAMQCGYCTSGMIMAASALLQKTPNPSVAEIRHALQGNLCRCGTYPRIIAAVQHAAHLSSEAQKGKHHA